MIGEKYQVVSLIGSGGMGTVYRVQQLLLGKEFALKFLDLHKKSDVTVRRFQQEARTASQLQHPTLVEVHDFGMYGDNQPYLVMDLVEGETLAQILKRKGALSTDYVIALFIQLCFGLMYAHERGVVHRDIKPANIMLLHPDQDFTEGNVKIVDFGIAKLTQSEDGQIQSLTKTGEVFGSPLYMSPEQCKGATIDRRSDIYSLGCVIFECLTGSPPFFGDTAMSTMMKKLSEQPVSLKEGSLGREFPAALEDIVRKCLSIKPEDRYQDLSRLTKDLIALQSQGANANPVVTPRNTASRREGTNAKQALLVVAVMIVSSLATAAFDRAVVFKEKASAQNSSIEGKEVGPTAEMSANYTEVERFLGSNDEAKRKRSLPWFGTKLNSAGGQTQILHFPVLFGDIGVDGRPAKPAFHDIECRSGAPLNLRLRHMVAGEPAALAKLIGLNIKQLSYSGSFAANNSAIAIIEKFPSINSLSFQSTSITSLGVLNTLPLLEVLDISKTKVPSSEFVKLKHLGNLKVVVIGPIEDPETIFNALASDKKLEFLSYSGGGKGLSHRQVAALARLTPLKDLRLDNCPHFDDADLAKMSALKNLETLVIEDCGLTGKSVGILPGLKRLERVRFLVEGWSKAEIDAFWKLEIKKELDARPKGQRVPASTLDEAVAPLLR